MRTSIAKSVVSPTLIVALTLTGIIPSACACDTSGNACASERCCGTCDARTATSAHACCSTTSARGACHCVVESKRPATPPEQHDFAKQFAAHRGDVALAFVVVVDTSGLRSRGDASSDSFLADVRRQAVLCRWLI